ncbi:MAG: Cache 3/Cache 2 fusion domain-containing protein [Candidatus Sungbacteria bacterium]|nr:Cache 3/Cache 2 fusion domain-containing protein [Candidatus Sungbacteria bacterium]
MNPRRKYFGFSFIPEAHFPATVIIVALAVFGLYAFLSISNYQTALKQELAVHEAALDRSAIEVGTFFEGRFALLRELADVSAAELSNKEELDKEIDAFLQRNQEFEKIRISDSQGQDITVRSRFFTAGKEDLGDARGSEGFEKGRRGESFVGTVYVDANAIPSTEFSFPIISEGNTVIGVMLADLDLRRVWDAVSQIPAGEKGRVYVVDNKGNLAAHPDRQFALTTANLTSRPPVKEIQDVLKSGLLKKSEGEYINEKDDLVYALAKSLPFGWGIIIEEPKSDFFRSSTAILQLNGAVVAIIALLIFFLFLGSRSFLAVFRELDEERNTKEEIITNLSDGLIHISREGRILLTNRRALDLLFLKKDPTSAKFNRDTPDLPTMGLLGPILFPDNAPDGIFSDIKPTREFNFNEPQEIHLEVDTIPIQGGREIILLVRDVTRERVLSRLKTEFISIAAHQLRTPLSAVKWTLRVILDGDAGKISTAQREYLESTYDVNERMIKLVNDLLNVSRIEEGRFEYQFREEDILAMIETAAWPYKELAGKKGISMLLEKPKAPLPLVVLDKDRFQMIIQNLLENAISYTPAGGIIKIALAEEQGEIGISVSDTGIGIPMSDQKRLFGKFYRSEGAVKMNPHGSGLGLFIARNIVLRHGGTISVKSEVGKGTTFHFTVPKAGPSKKRRAETAAPKEFIREF